MISFGWCGCCFISQISYQSFLVIWLLCGFPVNHPCVIPSFWFASEPPAEPSGLPEQESLEVAGGEAVNPELWSGMLLVSEHASSSERPLEGGGTLAAISPRCSLALPNRAAAVDKTLQCLQFSNMCLKMWCSSSPFTKCQLQLLQPVVSDLSLSLKSYSVKPASSYYHCVFFPCRLN